MFHARPMLAVVSAVLLATTAALAAEPSCREQLGTARAAVLVDRCEQVSPATHPPCNSTNPCSLIVAEIRRGCDMLGTDPDAPGWCRDYRR